MSARKKSTKKRGKKKSSIKMPDMSNVEGKSVLLPEGRYNVTVFDVEENEGSGEHPYLNWTLNVIDKNSRLWYMTSKSPQSLWNLRGFLETCGVDIPTGDFSLDLDEVIGKELTVQVEHEEYNNKMKAKVVDYMPLQDEDEDDEVEVEDDEVEVEDDEEAEEDEEEEAEEDEEEEEPSKSEEDDEGYTEGELGEMTAKELQEVVNKNDLDVELKGVRGVKKKLTMVIGALEEEGLLLEDDDD